MTLHVSQLFSQIHQSDSTHDTVTKLPLLHDYQSTLLLVQVTEMEFMQ